MEGYDAATSGQDVADVYDDRVRGAQPEQLELLCELAAKGPALELGIGSGRLALPLVSRSVEGTASTHRKRRWPSCGPNQVETA